PDGADPRAGRHVRRFNQTLECRMSTPIQMMPSAAAPKKPVAPVQKEDAMWLQKEMINRNYHELATAREAGRKVSATFVPGNLNELLMCFNFARSLPETNALQNG